MATEKPTTEFDLKEISKHRSRNDLWVTVNGQVLNVTEYLEVHPGGPDVLLECAGGDATSAFTDAGHSEEAVEIMQKYLIGTLRGAKVKSLAPTAPTVLVPVAAKDQKSSAKIAGVAVTHDQAFGIAMVVVGVAAAVGLARHSHTARDDVGKIATHWTENVGIQALKIGGSGGGSHSFASGFAVASGVFLTASLIGFKRFTSLLPSFGGKTMQYPKTIPATKSVAPSLLSVRGYLEPKTYQSLPLMSKTEVAPGVFRFVFGLPSDHTVLGLPCGQHIAIKATVDGDTVTRSYTPVSNNSDLGRLELVIRCYPDGLLTGKYMRYLQPGDEVEVRGPKGPMRYRKGLAKEIGMVAGGTGITPMFALIRAICEDEEDTTRVSLIYANRSEADMLLRDELATFSRRYPANLRVWYMIDRAPEDGSWKFGTGYVTRDTMLEHLPGPGKEVKMMLCGPPGMVKASMKGLVGLGFEEPGAVAKMTDQIFLF